MTVPGEAKLLNLVTEEEVVQVCQQLVRTKSVNPPGDERQIAEFTAAFLKEAGFEAEVVMHAHGRGSTLAYLKGAGGVPGLLFSAHLDTVPVGVEKWVHPPFDGVFADGKVWGRGSSDMKGGMAAMMVAAKHLAAAKLPLRGDLVLAFTAGEEIDSLGAEALVNHPMLKNKQALIVSEPSSNDIYVAEKGALWLEISTQGKTAHGSMPDLGVNAVMMMVRFLEEFEKLEIPFDVHPMLGNFSRSVNTIEGGVKTNVVPDHCAVTIDMRTVPGQKHAEIIKKIEGLFELLSGQIPQFRASLKVVNDRPPVTTASDHLAVRQFNAALARVTGTPAVPKGVRYYTDAATYVPVLGYPMIICGPGEAGMAHQPNEYVEASKLLEAARIYLAACLDMLA